jgi:hypothetical protein
MSHVCALYMSVTRHILPMSINVICFCDVSMSLDTSPLLGMKMLCCYLGGGRRICTRWVSLNVTAEDMKIYSFIHLVKIPYLQVPAIGRPIFTHGPQGGKFPGAAR